MTAPICPYCGWDSRLVGGDVIYPHRPDLFGLKFWSCTPCGAYVGCHKSGAHVDGVISDGTFPLGRLANSALRQAKSKAHACFDPLWRDKIFPSRKSAYKWLANELGIHVNECHIGLFDEKQCMAVVSHCEKLQEST